jgi:hypothetical protein
VEQGLRLTLAVKLLTWRLAGNWADIEYMDYITVLVWPCNFSQCVNGIEVIDLMLFNQLALLLVGLYKKQFIFYTCVHDFTNSIVSSMLPYLCLFRLYNAYAEFGLLVVMCVSCAILANIWIIKCFTLQFIYATGIVHVLWFFVVYIVI